MARVLLSTCSANVWDESNEIHVAQLLQLKLRVHSNLRSSTQLKVHFSCD